MQQISPKKKKPSEREAEALAAEHKAQEEREAAQAKARAERAAAKGVSKGR